MAPWRKLLVRDVLAQTFLLLAAAGCVLAQEVEVPRDWEGDIGLGYTKTAGNTDESTLAVTANAARPLSGRVSLTFRGDYFGATSEGETTTNKGDALTRLELAHTDRIGYFGEMGVAFDQFKELEMRLAPGAGVSYLLLPNEGRSLTLLAGANWVKDYFRDETSEARAMLRFGDVFKWTISERSSFEQSFDIFFNVEDSSDYIFHAEAAVLAYLTERLFLKFAVIDDYDNEPLSEEIKKNDLYLVTTLNYAF